MRSVVSLSLVALFVVPFVAAIAAPMPFPSDPLPGATSTDPAVVGKWEAPFDGQVPAVSMALLSDGRVLYWSGVEAGGHDEVFFLGTPINGVSRVLGTSYDGSDIITPANPDGGAGDLFCAGLTILPDGRVLTSGGSAWHTLDDGSFRGFVDGTKDTRIFDPADNAWHSAADMNWNRWYPTLMTRSDGSVLAASGIDNLPDPRTHNTAHEQWTPDGGWVDLSGTNLLPLYPRLFTIPSGEMKGDIFYETDSTLWGPFGEHPEEVAWNFEQVMDNDTTQWTMLGPSLFGSRQHGATVMLPLDPSDGYTARLLTFGGSLDRSFFATSASELTTLNADGSVGHEATGFLNHPRWMDNGVLLPDGSVLAVGGGLYDNVYAHGQPNMPVLVAEQFDPATKQWEQRAPMTVPRMYHSTALLLPDGRVLAGGHVPLPVPWTAVRDNMPYEDQIAETRLEIYEPPYLHWGVARPSITSAPAAIHYGAQFTVETPDAATVKDAILVHPGATTHVWDADQRAIVLPIASRGTGTLSFVAPPDGDVATPGPWMIFLRTEAPQGLVPSVAAFTTLG